MSRGTKSSAEKLRFAARPPRRATRAAFTRTWWGQAWTATLEGHGPGGADAGRLQRGRSYARGGHVGEVTVASGRVDAPVYGSEPGAYRTSWRIEPLNEDAWQRFLEVARGRASHTAALLDKQLPEELVEEVQKVGVGLLPRAADLRSSCTCPDWGEPCKHGAALFYQVAQLIDEDPTVLLLLRGRNERWLWGELANQAQVDDGSGEVAARDTSQSSGGVSARAAFAAERAGCTASLPELAELASGLTEEPPQYAFWLVDERAPEGRDSEGLTVEGLRLVAQEATVRARALLTDAVSGDHTETEPCDEPDMWHEAARLAAVDYGLYAFSRIAAACERSPYDLALAARAWGQGGADALEVLEQEWTPDRQVWSQTKELIRTAWGHDEQLVLRSARNRCTVPGRDVQLRYGRDGYWYPYRKEDGRWWPAGVARADPVSVLSGLLAP